MTAYPSIDEARRLAARFAPPKPEAAPLPPEPVRHWRRVQVVMQEGPCTYLKIASRLGITSNHANTILKRLTKAGLVERVSKGSPGHQGKPSMYRLTNDHT